jgi:hypothetical protein
LTLASCGELPQTRAREEYVFYAQGVEIELGEDADEIISRLGKPNRTASAPSCAGLGIDEVYIYNGFKISAYREGDECEIVAIELTNDTRQTSEGISIGAPESSVIEVYGAGRDFVGGVEYISDDCRLQFYLSGGRVSGIKYLKYGD